MLLKEGFSGGGMVSSFEEGAGNESLMVGKLMLDWSSASVC